MNYLGVQGTVYKRGLEGKSFPRWARKPGLLYDAYLAGVKEREEHEKKQKKT